MNEIPKMESLQASKAEFRMASPDRLVDIGTPEEDTNEADEIAAMKKANAALQTARFKAIDDLMMKKGNELAVAIAAGDTVKANELRAGIKALEEQKDKAADRIMGEVEDGADIAQ